MKNKLIHYLASLLTVFLILTGLVSFIDANRSEHAEILKSQVLDKVSVVRAKLEASLNTRLSLVNGLKSFALTYPDFTEEEFYQFALHQEGNITGIRSLQLAPDAIVKYVYPLEGNQKVIGHNLLEDDSRRMAVVDAINNRRFVISGPINLIQGGVALIGRLPIYKQDKSESFWGFATILIDIDTMLKEVGIDAYPALRIAIRGQDGLGASGAMVWGASEVFDRSPVVRNVSLPYGFWELAAIPLEGFEIPLSQFFWEIVWGVITAILSGLFVFLILREPYKLSSLVKQKTAELQKYADNLDEKKSLLSSLMDSIPDLIFVKDKQNKYLACNDAFSRYAGIEKEKIIGFTDSELFYHVMPGYFHEDVNIDDGSLKDKHRFEEWIHLADGSELLVDTLRTEYFDASGESRGWLGISRDITLKHESEMALVLSESKFRNLIEGLQDVVYQIDLNDMRFEYVSPAVVDIFGYHPSDFISGGLSLLDLVCDEDRERFAKSWNQLYKSKQFDSLSEYRFVDKRGRKRWVYFSNKLSKRQGSSGLLLEGICRDITEQKKSENVLTAISEGVSRETGDSFFSSLVSSIADTLGVYCAFVSEIDAQDHTVARTIAAYKNGQLVDNFNYELGGTPCENVLDTADLCHFGEQVADIYPDDKFLQHLDIKGYIGIPLSCSSQELCGLIVILDNKPIEDIKLAEKVLRVFASRASAELERRRNEAQMRTLSKAIEQSPVSVLITDTKGNIQYANKTLCETTGFEVSEVLGKTPRIFKSNTYSPDFYENMWLKIRNDHEWHGELLNRRKDGSTIWESVSIFGILDETRKVTNYVGLKENITARKEVEKRLQLAATVFDSTAEAIIVTDQSDLIQMVNPAFTRITGYTLEEVIGKNPSLLNSGTHGSDFYSSMYDCLNKTGRWEGEIWNRRKNGEIFPEWMSIVRIKDEKDTVIQSVAIFNDITRKKQNEELIFKQANYDLLTGLPNRSLFMDRLKGALQHAKRDGKLVAVLYIDLDGFKWVNETLGHAIGDQFLKIISKRLCKCVRESDTVTRLSADHFIVILTDIANICDVESVIQKIIEKLKIPVEFDHSDASVTASVGVTLFPEDASEPDVLLRNADSAMHLAKAQGSNTYCFFTEEINVKTQRRMRIEKELKNAIKNNEFEVYYQPIIDTEEGNVKGAEALIRWFHPSKGIVSPIDFIPLAEETGLIEPIGEYVLKTVCNQIREWKETPLEHLNISVNLSPRQCADAASRDRILNVLREAKVEPNKLILEITESMIMEDNHDTANMLEHIKTLGIKLSIDDFGTGYSSLGYLKKFNVDILKVDQSFIKGIVDSEDDTELVKAIIAMTQSLHLKAVAEGVETAEQLALLTEMGCDYIQGYFYSKPIPLKRFENFVLSFKS